MLKISINQQARAHFFKFTASLALGLVTSLVIATDAYADDKADLIATFFKINAFKANFTQDITDKDNNLLQSNRGLLSMLRPNNFKMQVTEPEESLIVTDGKSVYAYDAMLEQVTIYNFEQSVKGSPLMLIMTKDKALWDGYNVKASSKDDYLITPKGESLVKSVTVKLKDNNLSSLTILEKDGKQNAYTFTLIDASDLKADDFTYQVPEGIEVDDQR